MRINEYWNNPFGDRLQLELEKYKPFIDNDWWVDQFTKDYVALCTFSYRMVTDVECETLAKRVKKILVENNVTLDFIHVGPFVWDYGGI